MKKIPQLIILIMAGILSCQSPEAPVVQTPAADPVDYNQIGIDHNKGLEFIFNKLSTDPEFTTDPTWLNSRMVQLTKEYVSVGYDMEASDIEKVNESIEAAAGKIISYTNSTNVARLSEYKFVEQSLNGMRDQISENQFNYSNRLQEIILNKSYGYEMKQELISALEIEIREVVPQEEYHVLLASTSVARHSMEYWTENGEKWLTLMGVDMTKARTNSIGLKEYYYWVSSVDAFGALVGFGIGGGWLWAGVVTPYPLWLIRIGIVATTTVVTSAIAAGGLWSLVDIWQ